VCVFTNSSSMYTLCDSPSESLGGSGGSATSSPCTCYPVHMATFAPITEYENNPASRYPWAVWFQPGQAVTLRMGEDFFMEPSAFARYVRKRANSRGLGVRVSIGYNDTVSFVTYRAGERRPVLPDARRPNGRGPLPQPEAPRHRALCTLCGTPLTPAAGPALTCRRASDPAWRCTGNRGA